MKTTQDISRLKSKVLKCFAAAVTLACLGAAASVPFYFESQSLYYKFGIHKTLLQAGKIFGLFALVLMLFQVVLVSRAQFLVKIFNLKMLFALHRNSGKLIGILVLLHPFFILAADDFTLFPFETRYWPEFLGLGLAVFVLTTILISLGQKRLGITYKTWQFFHRIGTPLIIILAVIHVRWVSESFDLAVPKTGLYIFLLLAGIVFVRIYMYRYIQTKKRKK